MLEKLSQPLPEQVMVDSESGYAINVPVEDQMPPNWWRDPATAERIMMLRGVMGIRIEDDLWRFIMGEQAPNTAVQG